MKSGSNHEIPPDAMDNLSADSIAIVVVVAVFVFDKILGMLKNRGIDVQKITRQIDDLYQWHDVRDEDGVLRWHNRKSLEDAMKTLAQSMADLSRTLVSIDNRLERLDNRVQAVAEEVKEH